MKTYNPLRLAQAVLCRLLEQQHIPTAAADKPDGQDIKEAARRRNRRRRKRKSSTGAERKMRKDSNNKS